MTLDDVPRNNLAAVRRYYVDQGRRISRDTYRCLRMSQDDPDEFDRMTAEWDVFQPESMLDRLTR